VRVQVFGRDPVAGRVKTRLIPALGAARARLLYLDLLRHVLDRVEAAAVGPVELWLDRAPTDPAIEVLRVARGVTVRVQEGAHLGARMAHALEDALASGALPVLVGSDLGGLTSAHCRDAAAALADGAPAVFAPADDGGYGLVGLSAPWPGAFEDEAWGDAGVMDRTRARAARDGVALVEVDSLWDVDAPADLARLDAVPALAAWARDGGAAP
jgi:rSAM/selenodomain-associated transferase 1